MQPIRRVTLLIFGGLAFLAGACMSMPSGAQESEPVTATFDQGSANILDSKFEDAIKEFDEAIRLHPDSAEAFYQRGLAYENLHQISRAFSDFDQAVALKPDFLDALDHRGRVRSALNMSSDAIKDLDKVIALKPDDAMAYDFRAAAYIQLGQAARAVEDLDQAIKLKPDDAQAFELRGIAWHALGQTDQAFDDFAQAIRLKPDFAMAFNDRGAVYTRLGQPKRAIEDYDQAIKLQPNMALAYFNRGLAQYSLGELPAAIASFSQAISLRSNYPAAFNYRGNSFRRLRQYDSALADYDQAIRLKPNDPVTFVNRANVYVLTNQHDLAIENFNKARDAYDAALRVDPKNSALLLARADAGYYAERWPDAIADYSSFIALSDEPLTTISTATAATAYLHRGWSHSALGEKEAALADVEMALRRNPKIGLGRFWQANLLLDIGRYQEAIAIYNDIADAKNPEAYFNRGVTNFCLGRYQEAEEDLLRYAQITKDELSTYSWIYIFRTKRGMPDDGKMAGLKPPLGALDWISQIHNLYVGQQTLAQTEAAMNGPDQGPWQKQQRSCAVKFFLGEYKLEHGDRAAPWQISMR